LLEGGSATHISVAAHKTLRLTETELVHYVSPPQLNLYFPATYQARKTIIDAMKTINQTTASKASRTRTPDSKQILQAEMEV
jgi:hypothetical protein